MFVNVQRTLENMGHFFFSFVGCQFLSVSCKVRVSILLQSQLLDLFPGAAASHCVWHDLPLVFHVVAQPSWPWVLQPPRWTVPPPLLFYGCILAPGESLWVLLHSQQREGVGCFLLWPPGCSQLLTQDCTENTDWCFLPVRVVTPTTCLNRSCFNQHTHIYTYIRVFVLSAHVCVHVYMYMCIHMYVHIYMYTHTYIYTSLCMYNLQLKLLQVCGMWVALSLVSLEWYPRHNQSPSWKSLFVIRLPACPTLWGPLHPILGVAFPSFVLLELLSLCVWFIFLILYCPLWRSVLFFSPSGMSDSFVTLPWTVAHQAPLSMGFSRQEHWSGLPFPSPGDLPGSGIESTSPALAAGFFTTEPPRKPYVHYILYLLNK